uniref:Ycf15 n=1 Tax=Tetraena mongolica TaxID=66646 RepID=A0A3G4R223_9ROSI|nr:Ycf15 [Tetraena mongolica]YP_010329275.1 Ycf15 [Zygophyllum kansuense]AYU56643.1 Ycf15 [Tetraena mongolica]AYU56716.1 Ycf15 [Tetraena mongolica]QUL61189.1 Ycf15 [Tetraena mongolica]QUL61190.1 Ycf15 [Tetraena mongolica]UJH21909.1 Ycf15 [Zygophyllum kansuense]
MQIFTTKKYWILFRIGPERRRKAGMPKGVYFEIHLTQEYPLYSTHFGNAQCQSH